MKRIIIILQILVISITAFAQQDKSLKFGIELDGKLKNADANTYFDSPTGVALLGVFAELSLTNHFSGRLKVGLNNTYIHQNAIDYEIEDLHFQEITKVTQSLDFSMEPVFYFFSTEQPRKVNLFASLPVTFETKSLGEKYIFRTKFMIVPTLGCRFDFTKHWGIEVSGGLGWRKYGKYDISSMKQSEMEYRLFSGIQYSF